MISEKEFKKLLDLVWYGIFGTRAIVDALESIGLDVNPANKNNRSIPLGHLYGIRTKLIDALLDAAGVTSDSIRGTILEEVDWCLFNLESQYFERDEFPKEAYQTFLNIFTSAGVRLPWEENSLFKPKDGARLHRALVKSNLHPLKGYLWKGADVAYIMPYNNGISYDDKTQRITAFALEVIPETISVSLNTTDSTGSYIFDGDTISADGEEFTVKLSEPETLSRLARYQRENKKIEIKEYNYQKFKAETGWKVGVAYERYGYIRLEVSEARTEEEAVAVAQKKLKDMTFEDLEKITSPLADSEEIDRDGVTML